MRDAMILSLDKRRSGGSHCFNLPLATQAPRQVEQYSDILRYIDNFFFQLNRRTNEAFS